MCKFAASMIDQIMQHKLNCVLLGITKPQEIEISERERWILVH